MSHRLNFTGSGRREGGGLLKVGGKGDKRKVGDAQGISYQAYGEDGYGECVARTKRVAIKQPCKDFIVVFCVQRTLQPGASWWIIL